MTIYGLVGHTHGWGKLITVISPAGDTALRAAIAAPADEVTVVAGRGRLTQHHARRAGALDRLIERHGIVVLGKTAWDVKKAELGDAIWR